MIQLVKYSLALSIVFIASTTSALEIKSLDLIEGKPMSKKHEFSGFGCNGKNTSPQLSWKNAPNGTKSFAVTAYDPDAPTGSGWWHWLVYNIPADVYELQRDAGNIDGRQLPENAQHARTDYGQYGFGGACPPEGDKSHRYQFKVFALNQEKINIPKDASAALLGYLLNASALEVAELEVTYKR